MPVTDDQAVADRETANLEGAPTSQNLWHDFGVSANLLLIVMALGAIAGHYSAIVKFTRITTAGM